jgi:hypothetical protein
VTQVAAVLLAGALLAWTPQPRERPVLLHIVSAEVFQAVRHVLRLPAGTRAFAVVWPEGHPRHGDCALWFTPDSLHLFRHELRHCEDGAWHE